MLLLIHCGLVALYGVKDLSYHWSRWWLVAYLEPTHYLNKIRLIGPIGTNFSEIWIKYSNLNKENTLEKYCLLTYNHFVPTSICWIILHINGSAQYCGNSSALAMELPQSCAKPSICQFHQPRLVIRTFHHQGRCSRGGHLSNEHSEEKYSCSYK